MDIWVFRQTMTAEEEANILATDHIHIDWQDVPNLDKIREQHALRTLMRSVYADRPPEEIAILTDQVWKFAGALSVEDTVAVPLSSRREVALGEITGPYAARTDDQGRLVHTRPVKWVRTVPMSKFYRNKDVFNPGPAQLERVSSPQARNMIRDKLPHRFNRFRRIKWLIGFLFLLRILHYIVEQVHEY
jgi:restriction system protein